MTSPYDIICLGAGPAGLTAGYCAQKENLKVLILEKDTEYVGGISRTVNYRNYRFDIGGHRFFSKSSEVEDFWTEILPHDMLVRPRLSRIYYNGKFFQYPLNPFEGLYKLGLWEAVHCTASYLIAQLRPRKTAITSFKDWVVAKFGQRLFEIFFESYTEKVWGTKCDKISADWAAQRIKGLSLISVITQGLIPKWLRRASKKDAIKSLIEVFRYPRLGPGMLWEEVARRITSRNGTLAMGSTAVSVRKTGDDFWRVDYKTADGQTAFALTRHLISSIPIAELVRLFRDPKFHGIAHAEKLKYRDFLTVAIMVRSQSLFQDNWIYIHDPSVRVGRIQNFGAWSPEMIPEPGMACLGLEYFCNDNDQLWLSDDSEIIALARRELVQLKLVKDADIVDGHVVRQPKAYPVYDQEYQTHVTAIREEFAARFANIHLIGRNGMHKYNNQDHAMMTAMLTIKNIKSGRTDFDVWNVNQDAEYLETDRSTTGLRLVPMPVETSAPLKKAQ